MKIEIVDLTSAEMIVVRSQHSPEFISIHTQEKVELGPEDFGLIEGKKGVALKGCLCNSGIVHPNFSGYLEPFFTVWGSITIPAGSKIAHVLIFRGK